MISLKSLFKDRIVREKSISLGNSFELPGLIKTVGRRVTAACFPNLVKFSKRLSQVERFGKYLLIMTKHHGATYTVNYLKTSQLAVQKAVGGYPVKSP